MNIQGSMSFSNKDVKNWFVPTLLKPNKLKYVLTPFELKLHKLFSKSKKGGGRKSKYNTKMTRKFRRTRRKRGGNEKSKKSWKHLKDGILGTRMKSVVEDLMKNADLKDEISCELLLKEIIKADNYEDIKGQLLNLATDDKSAEEIISGLERFKIYELPKEEHMGLCNQIFGPVAQEGGRKSRKKRRKSRRKSRRKKKRMRKKRRKKR